MKMKAPINPKVWSPAEVNSVIALYRTFLECQLSDLKYQKAGAVRTVMANLGRTRGSIEAKLMNVSGCLVTLGAPQLIVKGYKPLSNYSADMLDPVKAGIVNQYARKAA